MKRLAWLDAAPLAVFVVFYWKLTASLQTVVGICPDDAWLASIGRSAYEWALGCVAQRHVDLKSLPAIVGTFHGAWSGYMIVPFMLAFGRTVDSILISVRVSGVLLILAVYAAGTALYDDRGAALAAAGLLTMSPFFYLLSLSPGYAAMRALPFALAALALAAAACRGAGLWAVLAAAFSLGVAVGCRCTMLAWAAGLAACVIASRRAFAGRWKRPGLVMAAVAVAFAAPLAPLLPSWLAHGAGRYLAAHLFRRETGDTNVALWSNLILRAQHVWALPNVSIEPTQPLAFDIPWFSILFLAACAFAANAAWKDRRRHPLASWPWILGATFFALSLFSPTDIRQVHMTPLFFLLALAVGGSLAIVPSRARMPSRLLAAAALACCGAALVKAAPRFERDAARSEKEGVLYYRLLTQSAFGACRRLGQQPGERVAVLVDRLSVYAWYCAPERDDVYPPPPLDATRAQQEAFFDEMLKDPGRTFLMGVSQPPQDGDDIYYDEAFSSYLKRRRLSLQTLERFDRADGSPGISLVKVAPRIVERQRPSRSLTRVER